MCVRKEEAALEWVIQWCDNTGTEKDCDTVAESEYSMMVMASYDILVVCP